MSVAGRVIGGCRPDNATPACARTKTRKGILEGYATMPRATRPLTDPFCALASIYRGAKISTNFARLTCDDARVPLPISKNAGVSRNYLYAPRPRASRKYVSTILRVCLETLSEDVRIVAIILSSRGYRTQYIIYRRRAVRINHRANRKSSEFNLPVLAHRFD